jgi:hypothetical protein
MNTTGFIMSARTWVVIGEIKNWEKVWKKAWDIPSCGGDED